MDLRMKSDSRSGRRTLFHAALGLLAVGVLALFLQGGAEAGKYTERYAKMSSLLVDRGMATLDKNQLTDAQKLFEQAIVANPQNAQAYSYLGYVWYRQGKGDVAGRYFSTALEIDPNQLKALSWGGQADLTTSNLESAEAKLQRLSRICGTGCAEYKLLSDAVTTYKSSKKTN